MVWHTAGETSARTTQSRVIDTLAAGAPRGGGVALAWGRRCGVAHGRREQGAHHTVVLMRGARVARPVRAHASVPERAWEGCACSSERANDGNDLHPTPGERVQAG